MMRTFFASLIDATADQRSDRELRALIRRMSCESPLWGAPRIHGELLMLGCEVALNRPSPSNDRPITPRSPRQNGHVERLLGSVRRECLNHLVISGEAHLRRILKTYTPTVTRSAFTWPWIKKRQTADPHRRSAIVTIPVLGGLHHQYVRV